MAEASKRVPSYVRIKQALLEEIQQGEYVPGQSFITEQRICDRFEVSRITAVRALQELVQVGVLVRKQGSGTFVAEPVKRETNTATTTLSRLIGFVCNYLYGQHVISMLRGIEHVCREEQYHLLVFDSGGSPETERLNLERARQAGVQGLIVYPVDGYTNFQDFDEVHRNGPPLIMLDRYYPTLSTNVVVADNFEVGYQLTRMLIEQGHHRIAFFSEETSCTSVLDRFVGYKQAFRDRNLTLSPDLAVLRPYVNQPEARRLSLLRSWQEMAVWPSSFLAVNSYILVQVIRDLMSLGVDISEGIALASMDNSNPDTLFALASASATLPSFEMGVTAMQLLGKNLEHTSKLPVQHIVLPVELSSASITMPAQRGLKLIPS